MYGKIARHVGAHSCRPPCSLLLPLLSSLQRLNSVTSLATSAIMVLVVFVALVSYPNTQRAPKGELKLNSLAVVSGQSRWSVDRRTQDFAIANFDIDADFSDLFNWNTKQVFVSLAADWVTKKHGVNTAVIWDRIIRLKQDSHIVVRNVTNKYAFKEVSRSLKNVKNASFTLKYNVMPHVGLLAYGDEARVDDVPLIMYEQGRYASKSSGGEGEKPQALYY